MIGIELILHFRLGMLIRLDKPLGLPLLRRCGEQSYLLRKGCNCASEQVLQRHEGPSKVRCLLRSTRAELSTENGL